MTSELCAHRTGLINITTTNRKKTSNVYNNVSRKECYTDQQKEEKKDYSNILGNEKGTEFQKGNFRASKRQNNSLVPLSVCAFIWKKIRACFNMEFDMIWYFVPRMLFYDLTFQGIYQCQVEII